VVDAGHLIAPPSLRHSNACCADEVKSFLQLFALFRRIATWPTETPRSGVGPARGVCQGVREGRTIPIMSVRLPVYLLRVLLGRIGALLVFSRRRQKRTPGGEDRPALVWSLLELVLPWFYVRWSGPMFSRIAALIAVLFFVWQAWRLFS